jgi:hypothetical protein
LRSERAPSTQTAGASRGSRASGSASSACSPPSSSAASAWAASLLELNQRLELAHRVGGNPELDEIGTQLAESLWAAGQYDGGQLVPAQDGGEDRAKVAAPVGVVDQHVE